MGVASHSREEDDSLLATLPGINGPHVLDHCLPKLLEVLLQDADLALVRGNEAVILAIVQRRRDAICKVLEELFDDQGLVSIEVRCAKVSF